jgi:hypothetical protein
LSALPAETHQKKRKPGFAKGLIPDSALDALLWIHRDPFDRMLISQALLEGVPILTADEKIAQYPVEVIS